MTPFNAITLGDFISAEEMSIVIESFIGFYHNVTAKHQKRSKLHIIGGERHIELIRKMRDSLGVREAIELVANDNEKLIRELYQSTDILFLPVKEAVGKVIPEALSFGIPILCYESEEIKEELNHTCGMFVEPYKMRGHCVDEFMDKINMLYFDPEVRKILSKGALKQYKECFEWGRSEVLPMAVAS